MNRFLVASIVLAAISAVGAIPIGELSGIEEISHVPEIGHLSELSHVTELSHVSEVSHIPEVSHVPEVSHIPEVSPVSEVSHVGEIAEQLLHKEESLEEHSPKSYNFKYGVNDPLTGDVKSQHEVGHGGVVHGEYSVKEADGTMRIVKYTADPHNGFNAKVYKSGHAIHPPTIPHHQISSSAAEHSYQSSHIGHR